MFPNFRIIGLEIISTIFYFLQSVDDDDEKGTAFSFFSCQDS